MKKNKRNKKNNNKLSKAQVIANRIAIFGIFIGVIATFAAAFIGVFSDEIHDWIMGWKENIIIVNESTTNDSLKKSTDFENSTYGYEGALNDITSLPVWFYNPSNECTLSPLGGRASSIDVEVIERNYTTLKIRSRPNRFRTDLRKILKKTIR